ncbi:attachment protein [Menangle virus]|uniref:Attachment protein n=1 Tax=Menangle virus TaxID=152219 RepID=Q91MJ8_9MONO|nr:attachment protein [Menangle virus]
MWNSIPQLVSDHEEAKGKFTDIPLQDDTDSQHPSGSKSTCRTLFRTVSIILSLVILVLGVTSTMFSAKYSGGCATNSQLLGVSNLINQIQKSIDSLISEVNQVSITTAVTLPIKIMDFGKSVTDQVTQMIRQCNTVCKGPGQKPGSQNVRIMPSNNLSTFQNINMSARGIAYQDVPLTFVRPIKNPQSCSRFPSYSVSFGVHCFANAVTDQTCELNQNTFYRVVLSVSKGNISDPSSLETKAETRTPKGTPVRTCSIISSVYGCYLLCSKATVPESEEMKTIGFSQMFILYLSMDSKRIIYDNIVSSTSAIWSGLYPGEGAGIWHMGQLFFPLWGGIPFLTPLGQKILNSTLDIPEVGSKCKSDLTSNPAKTKDMLFSPYYGENVMVFGFLTCYLLSNVPTNCHADYLNSTVLGFGSKAQFYDYRGIVYMYIQSAGWYPFTQIFRITLQLKQNRLQAKSIKRIEVTSTTRPGNRECSVLRNCPYICATGLFQVPWIVNSDAITSKEVDNMVFVQAWAADFTEFRKGILSLCSQVSCPINDLLSKDNSYMRDTTTYCFPQTVPNILSCTSFVEWGGDSGNPINILEIHYEVIFVAS